MNLKNKAFGVILLALLFISISSISAVDYSLTGAHVDLEIQENGLISVAEQINYHFDSSANGVYRDIRLKEGQSVENLQVYVDGAYSEYQIIHNGNTERIKIYLYRDAAKTKKITSGTDIKVYLEYEMPKVVKVYNDVVTGVGILGSGVIPAHNGNGQFKLCRSCIGIHKEFIRCEEFITADDGGNLLL